MTIIASLDDLSSIVASIQQRLTALETTVSALGAPACMQNGVINANDALLTSISINGTTGAITFALNSANTVIVQNTQGVLVPVGLIGASRTLTPATLPASGNTECVGIEIDAGGNISLNIGGSAAGNLPINQFASPATTAGALRLADIALANVSGVYQLGSTTTMSQGTNWQDRRPWARGANYSGLFYGGSALTTSSATLSAIGLTTRIECTGVPVRIRLSSIIQGSVAAVAAFDVSRDGSVLASNELTQVSLPSGAAYMPFYVEAYDSPPAGSHLYAPTWAVTAGTATIPNIAADPIYFGIEEIVRQSAANGTI